jgi:3-phosphoshikimate 1-carboxyvinyltransferase
MKPFVVSPVSHLEGELSLSGDKSIAHRSIIISAISRQTTRIENFPTNKDCLSTIKAFKKLGVKITKSSSTVTVNGAGLLGLRKPKKPILVGNSGTTLRLLLGVLAGQNFKTELIAGASLSQRPMRRVTEPLRMMGALIKSKVRKCDLKNEEYPPITIKGGNLKPIKYKMPVASAQAKSAILLAGLYTRGATEVIEPIKTRDHTERMLRLFKADIKVNKNNIVIKGNKELISPGILAIPGDISSAAFFIVLATIIPDSKVLVKNVSLNPLRTGVIRVLKRMGADIKIQNPNDPRLAWVPRIQNDEPAGDILIKSSRLKGTTVRKEEVPSLIDELPILMVAASNARGVTVFEGVGELRVKETDRIKSMAENLKGMGASIQVKRAQETENIIIEGVKQLKGSKVRSYGDHRTAMSMIIAGLKARGKTIIDDITCISKSFPQFLDFLTTLMNR